MDKLAFRLRSVLVCAALTLAAALPAQAVQDWKSVDDATLSSLRGGFIDRHGFQIHFRLENLVAIDGMLKVHNRLEIPWGDSRPQVERLVQDTADTGGVRLTLANQGLATLIQNTLNDKFIDHMRIINVELRSPGGLAGIGAISRIQAGLISALR